MQASYDWREVVSSSIDDGAVGGPVKKPNTQSGGHAVVLCRDSEMGLDEFGFAIRIRVLAIEGDLRESSVEIR